MSPRIPARFSRYLPHALCALAGAGLAFLAAPPPPPGVEVLADANDDVRFFDVEISGLLDRVQYAEALSAFATVTVAGEAVPFHATTSATLGDLGHSAVLAPAARPGREKDGDADLLWRTNRVVVTLAAGMPVGGGRTLRRPFSRTFEALPPVAPAERLDREDPAAPPELAFSCRVSANGDDDAFDDLRPVLTIDANRDVFSPTNLPANLPDYVSLLFEGAPVPFTWEPGRTYSPGWRRLHLHPELPAAEGLLELRISRDLPFADGAATARDTVWAGRYAATPVRIEDVQAEPAPFSGRATVTLWLNRRVDPASLASNLLVSPSAGTVRAADAEREWYHWVWAENRGIDGVSWRYELQGDFRAGGRYAFALPASGLASPRGAARAASTNAAVVVAPNPAPALEFLDEGRNLARHGRGGVALRTDRIPALRLSVARVLPQNLVQALRHWGRWENPPEDYCDRDSVRTADLPALPADLSSAVATNAVALDDFAPAGEPRLPDGLYLLRAEGRDPANPERDLPSDARLVNRSDVGLSVRVLPRAIDVWAVRLSTAEPLPGARATAYAANNRVLASAVAGADGVATVPLAEGDEPWLVAVETDDGGYSYLALTDEEYLDELPEHPVENFPAAPAELDGFLFSDRGIYRHGDAVLLQGLVRDASGAAPAPLPLSLEFARPDGIVVATLAVRSDERGHVALPDGGAWTTPVEQPSGKWTARLRLPGRDGRVLAERAFSVEDFVPPQIRVFSEGLPAALLGRSGAFPLLVRSEYLFGAPAADLRAEVRLQVSPRPFRPAGYGPRWRFGSDRRAVAETARRAARGRLDAKGVGEFRLDRPELSAPPAAALRLSVQSSVFELGGRPISDLVALDWHVYPWYLGVETPGRAAEPGAEYPVRVRLVAPDGAPATNAAPRLRAELLSVDWEDYWEADDEGRWGWRWRRVERRVGAPLEAVATNAEARFAFLLPPGRRSYELRVAALDLGEPAAPDAEKPAADAAAAPAPAFFLPETSLDFATWGGDGSEDGARGPVRVALSPDRKAYAPGQTARVRLRAPFDGLAHVAWGQAGAAGRALLAVTNGEAVAEIPVTAALAPSFEVSATLVRPVAPEDDWSAHRAYGAATLRVADPARDLAPALVEPAVEMLPRGGAIVRAEARLPAAFTNADARATFLLVDEAVLSLTDEPVPDPVGRFGRPRWSGARLFDSWRALLRVRDLPYLRTAATGGDGPGSLLRRVSPLRSRRFVPLARAVSDVPFERGVARASFELPDWAGSVRVAAVAWSPSAAGAAAATARIAPRLVGQADGPRFLAAGDVAELSLAVHNASDEDALAAWSLRLSGPASPAPGAALSAATNLPAGGSAVVRVPVAVAPDAVSGEVEAVFELSGLAETHTLPVRLPLRSALPRRTVSVVDSVPAGASAELAPVEGFLPAGIVATVRADPSPAAPFLPALRWLAAYPWRCLEQTTSRAFPLLHAQGALRALAPDLPFDADAEARACVARVCTLLRHGRFSTWPDSPGADPFDAAWAGLLLAEAEGAGIRLSESVRTGYRAALRSLLREGAGSAPWNASAEERAEHDARSGSIRTLALLALAEAGAPDADWASALLDRAERLAPASRYRLALVLLRTGRPAEALSLLRGTEPDDGAAAPAWGMMAWLEADAPEAPARVEALRRLLLARRASWDRLHWGTTTDNAAALLAAGSLLRASGPSAPGAAPDLVLRRTASDPATGVLSSLSAALRGDRPQGGDLGAFAMAGGTVTNRGPGLVHLERTVTGYPDPAAYAAATNGLVVERRFWTLDHEPIDPARDGLARGDAVVVELSVRAWPDERAELRDIVLDELFPAGLEPFVGTAAPAVPWIPSGANGWIRHRETRDDRVVAFSEPFCGTRSLFYVAQAVSAGTFVLPPAQAEAMYEPSLRANTAPATLVIRP